MTRAAARQEANANHHCTVACFRAFKGQCEGAELTTARNTLHSVDMVLRKFGLSPVFVRYEHSMSAVSFRIVKGDKMICCWATETTLTLGGKGPLSGTMHRALHGVCEEV